MNIDKLTQDQKTELDRIVKLGKGKFIPEIWVGEAESKSNPFHDFFEWNNSKAGHEYRLFQARNYIRVIVQYVPTEPPQQQRVWISLKQDRENPGGGYRRLEAVLSDKKLCEQLLHEALEELSNIEKKYFRLKELAGVFEAVREVKATVVRKRNKLEKVAA